MVLELGDAAVGIVGGIALLSGVFFVSLTLATGRIGTEALGFGVGLVLLVQGVLAFHAIDWLDTGRR